MTAGYQVVMANAAPDPWPSGGIGSGVCAMAAGYQVVMANAASDPWPSVGIGSGRPDEAG